MQYQHSRKQHKKVSAIEKCHFGTVILSLVSLVSLAVVKGGGGVGWARLGTIEKGNGNPRPQIQPSSLPSFRYSGGS